MSINKVEMQDSTENVYYPHTDASVVKFGESDVGSSLSDMEKKQNKFTEDANGKLLYNNAKVGATKASELTLDPISGMVAKDVQAGIAEAFQYASNGKNGIVTAITGKGGTANNTMTFQQLANAISTFSQCAYGVVTPYVFSYNASTYSLTTNVNVAGEGITLNIPFVPKFIYFFGSTSLIRNGKENGTDVFMGSYSEDSQLKRKWSTWEYYNSYLYGYGLDANGGYYNIAPINANTDIKILRYSSHSLDNQMSNNSKVNWVAFK